MSRHEDMKTNYLWHTHKYFMTSLGNHTRSWRFFFCHCCPLTFGLIEKLEGHPRYLFFEVALRFRNPSGVIRTSPPPHSVEVPSYWFPHQQRLEKFICVRRRGRHKSWAWGLFPSKKWKKMAPLFSFSRVYNEFSFALLPWRRDQFYEHQRDPHFAGFWMHFGHGEIWCEKGAFKKGASGGGYLTDCI